MNVAERNRAIKKTLEQAYGRGKVRVRGSRGTGYGWVRVRIDHTPLDWESRCEHEALCYQAIRAAKIELYKTYTDDTCQSQSYMCNIEFNPCRYRRVHKQVNGAVWGQTYDSDDWVPVNAGGED